MKATWLFWFAKRDWKRVGKFIGVLIRIRGTSKYLDLKMSALSSSYLFHRMKFACVYEFLLNMKEDEFSFDEINSTPVIDISNVTIYINASDLFYFSLRISR